MQSWQMDRRSLHKTACAMGGAGFLMSLAVAVRLHPAFLLLWLCASLGTLALVRAQLRSAAVLRRISEAPREMPWRQRAAEAIDVTFRELSSSQ